MKTQTVREQLVEHALVLVKRGGFNGFSYRDLAELVGVKTSSIHYYFPSKDDLVLEVVREYSARAQERLRAIDQSLPVAEQARRYLAPVLAVADNQACLVGMLSADVLSVPDNARTVMRDFIRMHEQWLAGLFERALPLRDTPYPVPPAQMAQVVFGALQNGLTSARVFGDTERLRAAASLLASVIPDTASA